MNIKQQKRVSFVGRRVGAVAEACRRTHPPGLAGFSLYAVWKSFRDQVKKNNLNERAAAISFNFVMAIPAATIFLLTLIPYLPLRDVFHQQLNGLIQDVTPNENTAKMLQDFQDFLNENLHKTRLGLLSFGLLFMIFNASNAMMGVIRTFDRSIDNLHKPHFLRKRFRAIRLTIVVVFLFIGTLLMLAGQDFVFSSAMDWLNIQNEELKFWIRSIRWIVIGGLFFFSIGILYKYAPSVKKRAPVFTVGGFFATFLSLLVTWLFSIWVNNFMNLNKFYGSIGTVMILLILIYLNSLILLIGFELNIGLHNLKHARDKKELKRTTGIVQN